MQKLGLHICKISVGVQKINDNKLETYGIVIALFKVDNKNGKSDFFEEIFWLADISMDIVFKIFFLTLSNLEVKFNNRPLCWRQYTTAKPFFITGQVELVENKRFVAAVLDSKNEIFVFLVTFFAICNKMHSFCKTQIASLKVDVTPNGIFKLCRFFLFGTHNGAFKVNGDQQLYRWFG